MNNVKDLLHTKGLDAAATAMYDGLFRLVKTIPGNMELTKEEFKTISPILRQKFEDPDSVVDESTPEVGDEPTQGPAFATLTVVFDSPGSYPEFTLPESISLEYPVGKKFSYTAPVVDGFIASPAVVTGTLDAEGTTVTISYSTVANPPLYGTVGIIDKNRQIVTDRGTISNKGGDEIWINCEGVAEWDSTKDDASGKQYTQWKVGFRIDVPTAITEEQYAAANTYSVNSAGVPTKKYKFNKTQNDDQKTNKYNNVWAILDVEKMQTAFDSKTKLVWTYYFDWNADGGYEQIVHVVVDPTKVTLEEHEGQAWPQVEPAKVSVEPVEQVVETPAVETVTEAPKETKKTKKAKKAAEKTETTEPAPVAE